MKNKSRRSFLKKSVTLSAAVTTPYILIPKTAKANKKKIVFWLQPNFNKAADQLLTEQIYNYGKENGISKNEISILKVPGSEVGKKMSAALEVNSPPDVTRINEPNLARWKDNLIPLNDIAEKMRKVKGGINENVMALPTEGDNVYAVPMGINPQSAHVRMDLFEKAGYERFPYTWEKFIEASKKITKPPFYSYGMALGLYPSDSLWSIMEVVWAYGGTLVDSMGKPALDSPGTVEGFSLINDMYNKHKIIPRGAISWNNGGNNKAYMSGQIAYALNPTSIYSSLLKNKSKYLDKTALLPSPGGPDGRHRGLYTDYYGTFKNSPNPEIAKGLIEYFMRPENYSKFVVNAGGRYFPVYPALTNDPFWQSRPVFKELIKTVNVGHTLYYPGKLTKAMGEVVMNTTVQKQLQSMLVDGKSPANAVADAQEDMVNIYRRNGEPV